MATFKKFEDIECWKKARELTRQVYKISGKTSFARDFGLKDQIRRAAVSIMSNIAEGFDRRGTGESSNSSQRQKDQRRKSGASFISRSIRATSRRMISQKSAHSQMKQVAWSEV